tara:strand:+ start:1426 stop:1623 length:198 start_codon:yes stop_codon:yes gene_type:complete
MNDELFKLSKALATKMMNIEKDPDLVSIFSIARAHGYIVTSQLWHKELTDLSEIIKSIEDKNSAK